MDTSIIKGSVSGADVFSAAMVVYIYHLFPLVGATLSNFWRLSLDVLKCWAGLC